MSRSLSPLQHVFTLTMNERFTIDGGYIGEQRAVSFLQASRKQVCVLRSARFLTDL